MPGEPCVRRRRECPQCQGRFSTRERIEWSLPQVTKRDGRRESYDRAKIAQGVINAVKKRDIPVETTARIIDEVEHMIARLKVEQIPSSEIGSLILTKLFLLDQVAAVRFASVYLRFDDLASFNDLIDRIRTMPSPGALRDQYPLISDDEKP